MSITEKYNFRVSVNQFHQSVSDNFWDHSEQVLIDVFEEACLSLKDLCKENYAMIELGSNQCYYSLLFKHILGKNKTFNIMVEPQGKNLHIGKTQFELNKCSGVFYHNSIGKVYEPNLNVNFDVLPITLNEILLEQNLKTIDVLQCDIDGAETTLLRSDKDFFVNKKAKYIFLGTHGPERHEFCKNYFAELNYNFILDHPQNNIGWDGLLVMTS